MQGSDKHQPLVYGDHIHICGWACTVWFFALCIVLIGIGPGIAIGYGAFHRSDDCNNEMMQWKVDDYVHPYQHPVAIVNGYYFAVFGNHLNDESCIAQFAKTLRSKGSVHMELSDRSSASGRRLSQCTSSQVTQLTNCGNCMNSITSIQRTAYDKCAKKPENSNTVDAYEKSTKKSVKGSITTNTGLKSCTKTEDICPECWNIPTCTIKTNGVG